jgi:hypothetical protein
LNFNNPSKKQKFELFLASINSQENDINLNLVEINKETLTSIIIQENYNSL